MEQKLFALSLGFAGLILATQSAEAAQCAPRDQVVARLATGFDEARQGAGLSMGPDGTAQVVEIFASLAGSWTLVVTLPDGMSCILAAGQNWDATQDDLPAKGEPA